MNLVSGSNVLSWIGGGQPGMPELIVILVVVLLLFGAKRLPELSRSLGKSISEFRKGREEGALDEANDVSSAPDETKTDR